MAGVKRHHSSRNLSDHIKAEQKAVVDGDVMDTVSAEINSDPIEDSGSGPRAIIRRFYFKLPPGQYEEVTKEELLDWNLKHNVIPTLWKDELEPLDTPRIVMGKRAFTIVAICRPRFVGGVQSTIHEKPELIQDVINRTRKDTE